MTTFSTCDLCDAHKDEPGLRVLRPAFHSYGGRASFAGALATVKCYEDNSRVKEAVESPGNGRVLVVDGAASLRRALLGGNLAKAAERNGWAGLVIDGCVRDKAELAACAVGILALGLVPLPTVRRGEGQAGLAVQVQGTWIAPGDWLYADEDGIVVATRPLV
jgi:regulator of ribonuclease activity A